MSRKLSLSLEETKRRRPSASDRWERIRQIVDEGKRFIITTHVNADGDGLGSEMALFHFLRSRGKEAVIVNVGAMPENYRFLDPEGVIRWAEDGEADEALPIGFDAIFILDTGKFSRLGHLHQSVEENGATLICIDHHPKEMGFAHAEVIDTEVSSTGELVYDFITSCGLRISNPLVAEALFAALLTDTGAFRFANTTSRTHRIAAELIEAGADLMKVYHEIYERGSLSRLRLLGKAMAGLQLECGGRLAWFSIDRETLSSHGVRYAETERFVDEPRQIEGVEVIVYFLETHEGTIRVSIRSKGDVTVNEIARHFGGGGHPYAAGIRMRGPLQEAVRRVIGALCETLESPRSS